MRRFMGAVVAMSLILPVAVALAAVATIRDDFKQVGYAGNQGTLAWAGPWHETQGDDGDPATGRIHVAGDNCVDNLCLHLEGDGGSTGSLSIVRAADLAEFDSAQLNVSVNVAIPLLSGAGFHIDIRSGGGAWTTVRSYSFLSLGGGYRSETIGLGSHLEPDFELRFRGTSFGNASAYVDRVEIVGNIPDDPVTTTTTTAPTTMPTVTTPTGGTLPTLPTTTTTSTAATTTSSKDDRPAPRPTTTSTTSPRTTDDPATTTTTLDDDTAPPGGLPSDPRFPGGLRQTDGGLLADYGRGLMGDLDGARVQVLGAELAADYIIGAEVFKAAWTWIAALALLICLAVVAGMEWRRSTSRTSRR